MQSLASVWAWALAHPTASWWLITALVTALFGSAQKYAAKHPRAAWLLALAAHAGFNSRDVLALVARKLPPPPPAPPSGSSGSPALASVADDAPTQPSAKRSMLMPALVAACMFVVGLVVGLAGCATSGSGVTLKATPDQMACEFNRTAAIVECVRSNPDKPSIDACLAVVEGRHCEADAALDQVSELAHGFPFTSAPPAPPAAQPTDAGADQ